jgi:hypothetical protein
MGTWGPGNFQNDKALDYVGDLVDQLVKRIETIFASGNRADPDLDGEGQLVPSVALLSIVTEYCHAAPPKREKVSMWHTKYLQAFDTSMEDLYPDPDSGKERRRVIEETFTRLEQQSQAFWKW